MVALDTPRHTSAVRLVTLVEDSSPEAVRLRRLFTLAPGARVDGVGHQLALGSSANPAAASTSPRTSSTTQLFVWLRCERCERQAKLHLKREVERTH